MSQNKFTLKRAYPFPLGAYIEEDGYRFSFVADSKSRGIVIFSDAVPGGEKILFDDTFMCGSICSVKIEGTFPKKFTYMLLMDEELKEDPCAKAFSPKKEYMKKPDQTCKPINMNYDFSADELPQIPFTDKVFYMVHPRGYTMKADLKKELKGTLKGIEKKLPYLSSLGVTSLIMMPTYDFNERMELKHKAVKSDLQFEMATYKVDFKAHEHEEDNIKTNYWGYTDDNRYYAVKDAYCSVESTEEMASFVKNCHGHGIEVFLQFYFPAETRVRLIEDILLYWKTMYHVDGFHLMGANIPVKDLQEAPFLTDTFLLFENVSEDLIRDYDRCGVLSNEFMFDMRSFLKGDGDVAFKVARHIRTGMAKGGLIHYMAKQDTMRLYDMVAYQEKHNEKNGEQNADGTNYNCSWNCGVEGKTRKKQIVALRNKQMKNAMGLLLLSQGTPLLYGGDEFANSQEGNNNPYCQDNEISYIKWNELKKNQDLFEFTKALIDLRNTYPILKGAISFKGTDYAAYGYPDISFHGEEAWRTELNSGSHVFGVMYCNQYVDKEDTSLLYVAYNMHWEKHELALPKLSGNKKWRCILSTDASTELDGQILLNIPERTMMVLVAD